MSGHSKWSQIKRQKGAADVKRGATFSRLANAIIIAAKNGADPNANFSLKMAIEKAKQENMPKENIERAIARGSGKMGGVEISEALYEIIAPHNVTIIVSAATDNKNRTTSKIKAVINRASAKLANAGAVSYQYDKLGKIVARIEAEKKEETELLAIDSGALDVFDFEDNIIMLTNTNELEIIKKVLEDNNVTISEASIVFQPKNTIILDQEKADQAIKLVESLESLDDVTEVYSNFDVE